MLCLVTYKVVCTGILLARCTLMYKPRCSFSLFLLHTALLLHLLLCLHYYIDLESTRKEGRVSQEEEEPSYP